MTVLFKVSSEVRKNIAATIQRVSMDDTLRDMACKIHGVDITDCGWHQPWKPHTHILLVHK